MFGGGCFDQSPMAVIFSPWVLRPSNDVKLYSLRFVYVLCGVAGCILAYNYMNIIINSVLGSSRLSYI